MRFFKFINYERPYIILYILMLLIMSAVFYTDPGMAWNWNTFFYGLALTAIIMIVFFIYRYQRNLSVIRHMQEEEYENLSLEAAFYRQLLDEREKNQIRDLNRIKDKQKEYYDFIVSWFHEIKTPISVLRLMEQTEVDLKSFQEEVAKIEHYVDQALYYSKLDNFHQDYDIQNCELDQLIKKVIRAHSKSFISKKISLQLDAEPITVQSDGKWLQFIFNQLISNALKYTGENGKVTIKTHETSQEKQLTISDNGIGIEKMDLPRIFNRGFSGTNGRTQTKSTGMGLYLAQELSKKLGHYITCTSTAGEYTEFIIHFPKNYDPYLHIK
ncbi:sensor histidine kinase [Fictibacillus barbaricus]|uniref:histidine kinase n=2 Tax=Fictibacillus barbaricus TaxID=182136 RepID=A0ABS2ZA43_9BACL|nr:sensor histidine kinase [Fictibacillus barbaricus]MBN3545054.1 sensor histidine kinase [Fictibacillus barbaricus]GGB62099.1 two-component sensor histidine kinase [Fictibacillus barbaricus]